MPARGGWWLPLTNMTMRATSLVARFALSIWIARALGYDALGAFGLLTGLAGAAPALMGFGVSYHVNREIARAAPAAAYRLLRDRLALSLVCAITGGAVAGAATMLGLLPRAPWPWMGGAIILLELIAFDLHIALINLRRPVAANLLLFVRSASWIAPVILIGLLDPRLRSLDVLLGGWLAALVANFALLGFVLRDAPFDQVRRIAVDWRGLTARARRAPLVWLNDMAEVGQLYLDRFIVAHMLGLTAAGAYTLVFAVTHGVYVLVASGVTQLSVPRLVAAGASGWRAVLASETRRAMIVGAPLIATVAAGGLMLLPALGIADFRDHAVLFLLMLGAALLRPFADLRKAVLYGLHRDHALAIINLAGIVASVPMTLLCLAAFGLAGVGVAALATQLMLIVARASAARRPVVLSGTAGAIASLHPTGPHD